MKIAVLTLILVAPKIVVSIVSETSEDRILHQASPKNPVGYQPKPIEIQQALRDLVRDNLDVNKDGYVSPEELNDWLCKLHTKIIEDDIEKQWIFYDPLEQEVHSWDDYFPARKHVLVWDHYFNATYPELTGIHFKDVDPDDSKLQQLKKLALRAQTRWTTADVNGDSLLIREEFENFVHPEEGDDRTKELFLAEATEDLDPNKDGHVTMEEFLNHIQTIALEDEKNEEWVSGQKDNFVNYLDRNKDGLLDKKELRDWLIPEPHERHLLEVERLFAVADENSDNLLSVDEIIKNHDQMSTCLPPEYWSKGSANTSVRYSNSPHDEF